MLLSTDSGRDDFDGGVGEDTLSYERFRRPVVGRIGAGLEGDRARRIEAVAGGRGNDRIAGTRGADRISGGPGRDRIRGRGGDDRLKGVGGENVVFGGPGDDRFADDFDEGWDDARCGPGADSIDGEGNALARPSCEIIDIDGDHPEPAQPDRVTAEVVVLRMPCASDPDDRAQLETPARAHPWYRGGPFRTVVAEGVTPIGTGDLCRTRMRVTEAGAALPRPLPVKVEPFGGPPWAFILS